MDGGGTAPRPVRGPGARIGAITPVFSKAANNAANVFRAAGGEIDQVRIIIYRSQTDTLYDETVTFTEGETVNARIEASPNETLHLAMIWLSEGTVFARVDDTEVRAHPIAQISSGVPPVEVPVGIENIVFPGHDATRVEVEPGSGQLTATSSHQFSATVFNAAGEIAEAFVRWTAEPAAMGSINANGLFTPTGRPGEVVVRAEAINGRTGESVITLFNQPVSMVTVSGNPAQTAEVGQDLPQQFVVEIRDANGAGVAGQVVTFSASAGSVNPTSATTDGSGRAGTTMRLATVPSQHTFTATSGSFTASVSATSTIGSASVLSKVSGDRQTARVNQPLADALVVRVVDQFGNAKNNIAVTWTRASGTGTLGAATSSTGSNGESSNSYTVGSQIASESVTASIAGGGSVTFTMNAVVGAPANVAVVSGGSQTIVANTAQASPLIIAVTDDASNPVPGATVAWAVVSGPATLTSSDGSTNAQGRAQAQVQSGTGTSEITATVNGHVGRFSITAIVGQPAQMALIGTNPLTISADVDSDPGNLPGVLISDVGSNPKPNIPVAFTLLSGTTVLASATVATDDSGQVRLDKIHDAMAIDLAAGTYTIRATLAGVNGSPANITLTIVPGAPAKLVVNQGTGPRTAGQTLPTATVTVTDQSGNTVPGPTGNLTIVLNGGPGGTLLGTVMRPLVNGVATFDDLKIEKAGQGYFFTGSYNSLTTSNTGGGFGVSPAAPSKLGITLQPSPTVNSRTTLIPGPHVQVQDAFGNPVGTAGAGRTVTATVNGSATLSGTTTATTDNDGRALLSGIVVSGSGNVTLTVASAPLTPVTTNSITIVGGVAHHLRFATHPTAATAGAPLTPAMRVEIVDVNNMLVPTATDSVFLAFASSVPNPPALQGTIRRKAVDGVVSFADVRIDKAAGSYSLVATSGSLGQGQTNSFSVSPASASKLTFLSPIGAAVAGQVFNPAPVVLVQDPFGNTVNSSTASIDLTIDVSSQTTGGTLSGGVAVSANNGMATFGGISIDKAGPGYVLRAASGTLTPATSSSFGVSLGLPKTLSVSPANALANPLSYTIGGATPAVELIVKDAGGNPLPNINVSFTVKRSDNTTLTTVSFPTNAQGAVGYSMLSGVTVAGMYTVIADVGPNVIGSPLSAPVQVNPGATTRVGYTLQPPTGGSAGATMGSFTVALQDQFRNLTSSASGTIGLQLINSNGTATSATLTVGDASSTTSGGTTTFTQVSINQAGSYKLIASSGTLAKDTSQTLVIGAGAPHHLTITSQPTAGTAGSDLANLRVEIRNANDLLVTDATDSVFVGFASGGSNGATLLGTVRKKAVNGVVEFQNLRIDKAATNYVLSASGSSLPASNSSAFAVSSASAAKVVFGGPIPNATATVTIAPAITVLIQDQFGNTVSMNSTVELEFDPSNNSANGGTLSGTLSLGATNGLATFSNISINKAGAGYVLRAKSGVLATATSSSFSVVVGAAKTLTVTPAGVLGSPLSYSVGGTPPSVTLTLTDAGGNPVPNTNIAFAITKTSDNSAVGSMNVPTNAQGEVGYSALSLVMAVGQFNVIANAGSGITGSPVTGVVNVSAGATSRVGFTVQPPSSGTIAGQPMGTFTVGFQDIGRNPKASHSGPIALQLINADGTTPTATLTGGSETTETGSKTYTTVSVSQPGSYKLIASSGSLTKDTSQTFTVNSNVPHHLTITSQPTSATAGSLMANLRVEVRNSSDQLLPAATDSIFVAFASGADNGATLQGTVRKKASGGVVDFVDVRIDKAATGYAYTVTSPSLVPATSSAFAVGAGPATKLKFATSPGNTAAMLPLGPSPVVRIEDQFGNLTSSTAAVTLAFDQTSVAGGTLSGTYQNVAASAGQATFSNVRIDKVASGYVLRASSGTLTTDVSASFAITTGAVAAMTVSPTNALDNPLSYTIGGSVPSVTFTVRDAGGNPVPTASVALTVKNSNDVVVLGPTTLSTNAQGEIGYAAIAGITVAGTYTVKIDAGGGAALTGTVQILPGTVARVKFTTQPAGATNIASMAPFSVSLQDEYGNLTSTVSRSISLKLIKSDHTETTVLFSTDEGSTTSSGVKTFTTASISTTGSYKLVATSPSPTPALKPDTSAAFTISPAPGTALAFVSGAFTPPGQMKNDSTILTKVQVVNSLGGAVALEGVTVALEVVTHDPGSFDDVPLEGDETAHVARALVPLVDPLPTFSAATAVTNSSGIAEFSGKPRGKIQSFRIKFTATLNGTPVQLLTSNLALKAGGAVRMLSHQTTLPAVALRKTKHSSRFKVRLTDVDSNPVPGVAVAFGKNRGVFTDGHATAPVTDANGEAQAPEWELPDADHEDNAVTATAGSFAVSFVIPSSYPTKLKILNGPGASVANGNAFGTMKVQLKDNANRDMPLAGHQIKVRRGHGPRDNVFLFEGDSASVSDANGTVTLSNVRIDATAQDTAKLQFFSALFAPDTSAAFNVNVGAAAELALATSVTAVANVGSSFGSLPGVVVKDHNGRNTVTSDNGAVSWSASSCPANTSVASSANASAGVISAPISGSNATYGSCAITVSRSGLNSHTFNLVVRPTNAVYWTGAASDDWSNASNWVGGVPGPSTKVFVPKVFSSNKPRITDETSSADDVTIESGTELNIGTHLFEVVGSIDAAGPIVGTSGKVRGLGANKIIKGTIVSVEIGTTNCAQSSSYTLAGALTTTGATSVNCSFTVAGNTLDVGGELRVTGSNARLRMLSAHANNTVIVRGNAVLEGASSASAIEAGTLELKGNLTESGVDADAFSPPDGFVVKFTGTGTSAQVVSFQPSHAGSGNTKSHFDAVEIAVGAHVQFSSTVYIDNDLSVRGKLTVPSGKNLNIKTAKFIRFYGGSELDADGTVNVSAGFCKKHNGSGGGALPNFIGAGGTALAAACAAEALGGSDH
jgi:hypothetical protein